MPDRPDPLICRLIEKLKDDDPRTRCNAAGALRLHGSRAVDAIPALAELAADEHSVVRHEVRRALDRLRTAAA